MTLWPLFMLGCFLRLLVLPTSHPWSDEAVLGVMGLRVLKGDLPIFMSGQAYMGSLEAYLMAPIFAAAGPSAMSLAVLPTLLSCLTLFLTWQLIRKLFGARMAWVTTLLLAIPSNFLLWWSHQARSHYPLTVVFGLLLFWLTARLSALPPGPPRTRGYLVLGLLAGLAWWTNFLSVVYLTVAGTWLLWQERSPLLRPRWIGLVLAFFVGSSPFWLYQLSHQDVLIGAAVFEPPSRWLTYLGDFFTNALPILLGVPGPIRWTPLWVAGYLLTLLLLLFGLTVFAGRSWHHPASLAWLGLGGVNLLLVLVSVYGSRLSDHDQKYLFPLTTLLPLLLAHGILALWDRWRPLGALAALLPLTLNLAGDLSGQILWFRPAALAEFREGVERDQARLRFVEAHGVHALYGGGWTQVLTFLSGARILFADPYQDNYPSSALEVDGAREAGWFALGPAPAFEATVAAMGVRFEVIRSPTAWIYHRFSLDPVAIREISPARWRAIASPAPEIASLAFDRDAETRWESRAPQRPGMTFTLDLDQAERVAMVSWLPGMFQDVPRGIRLETSLDGARWRTIVDVPTYQGPLYWGWNHPIGRVRRGRVELRFPPHEARHLRLTQTGEDAYYAWSMREVYVHTADSGPAPEAPDVVRLVEGLRQIGVRFVYADHGLSTQIALKSKGEIGILPQNLLTDAHGWREPDPNQPDQIHFRPGHAIVVTDAEARGTGRRGARTRPALAGTPDRRVSGLH